MKRRSWIEFFFIVKTKPLLECEEGKKTESKGLILSFSRNTSSAKALFALRPFYIMYFLYFHSTAWHPKVLKNLIHKKYYL